MFLSVPSVVQN